MWRTSLGERVLRGSEGELFRASLAEVCDLVEDSFEEEELFTSGIEAFDTLQPGQKLAMLCIVGRALLDERISCPELTAVSEGTVAAVFEQARQAVELEVGVADDIAEQHCFWRQLICAAYREAEGEGSEFPPEASSD